MSTHSLSLEDRMDILELFARYAWAYDGGDAEAYVRVFTEDAVLADENGVLGTGHAEIGKAMMSFVDGWKGGISRHLNDQHVFYGNAQEATVYCYWAVAVTNSQDGKTDWLSKGVYVTEVVKTDDAWLIKKRTFYRDRAQAGRVKLPA